MFDEAIELGEYLSEPEGELLEESRLVAAMKREYIASLFADHANN